MKKITIGFVLLLFISFGTKAQDYKKVRTAFLLSQASKNDASKLESAKAELDKVIADPKAANNPETYLLKAEILGTISNDSSLKSKYPGADLEALQSLQKYLELEPGEAKLKEDRYAGINSIYASLLSAGLKNYNDKNWDSAASKFGNLTVIGDLFTSRKWTGSTFDTTSYLYAGAAAQNAKMGADAAKYYGALAQRKITGPEYLSIYDYLTKYYLNEKNEPEFQKYLALARQAYPQNAMWSDLEFANMTDNYAVEDMTKRFSDADVAKSLTASNYLDYGDYFMNNKKIKDLDPSKKGEYTNRATYAFSRAYELDTANAVAAYNAGVAAYNVFEDASEEARKIKGVTPAIKAQQAQAYKVVDTAADKSIEWLEKSYSSLAAKATRTNIEKNVVNKSTDLLYNLYAYKKDRSKVLNPKDYDKFDTKGKYYDSMHGKF